MLNRLQESDIKLLRVFYAVVASNGFTAAEPVLRMQRPNISAAIKKLEERLDLILCHRGRGGFQLTREGEVVYQEAQRLFSSFDNFVFNIKNLHDDFSGNITLVILPDLPANIKLAVSQAINSTMNKFADVEVNIQSRHIKDIEKVSQSGECHLVLSSYDIVKPEGIMFHDTEVTLNGHLYCTSQHPLAKSSDVSLDKINIEQYAAIGVSGLSSVNYIADDEHRLNLVTFSDSFENCMAGILTNKYIGLLPDYMAEPFVMGGQLKKLAGEAFAFNHQLYIMNGKNTNLNPVLRHLIRELGHFIKLYYK